MSDDAEVLDRFYGALTRGDVAAARACVTDDFVAWHSFDQKEEDLATAEQGWQRLASGFAARAFTDVRRSPVPGGFVQRQCFEATTAAGDVMAWPVCVLLTVQGGLISRLDEYIDRAGRYVPDGSPGTPGLAPSLGGAL